MKFWRSLVVTASVSMAIMSILPQQTHAQEPSLLEPLDKVAVVGHRGASAYAPEHTLVSYKQAIRMKADYVEVDLQMTKDGILIALHDTTLDRTTNVEEVFPNRAPWRVKDFTIEEIKQLDAGSWFNEANPVYAKNKYEGVEVPTLKQVIEFVEQYGKKDVGMYIETKAPSVYPGMEERLLEVLRQYDVPEERSVLLQSFSEDSLKKLHTMISDDISLVQLMGSAPDTKEELETLLNNYSRYADGLGPNQKLVDEAFMKAAHERGLIVHPYTVNEKEDMVRLLELGVDGVFTDVPDQFYELLYK